METLQAIVAAIIDELTRIQNVPAHLINKDEDFPIPGLIAASDAGGIVVSRAIDRHIEMVARRLMDDDPSVKSKYTRSEWVAAVRRAFGPALAGIDLDHAVHSNAKIVLAKVLSTIGKQSSIEGAREYAFGCTLFSHADASPFNIGAVRFEARLDWLERILTTKAITKITARRLKLAWQGRPLRKRKPSLQSIHEKQIIQSIGTSPYVCSIVTEGLAAEAGKEKALMAARFALTAIALLWQTPSKALNGFNLLFDGSPRALNTLTFVPGGTMLSGSSRSHMPHGPWIKPEDWTNKFVSRSDYFTVVGEIIEYFLSATGKVARPKLMNTLAQAILWFHEGCRESVSTMAIVKFSASMDALSLGRKAAGIRKLINARLGINDESIINKNGPTLKQAIDGIYSDGRSRTIHGTNDKLRDDWTGTRELAEQLARSCLLSCMHWAAENRSTDDPSRLAK